MLCHSIINFSMEVGTGFIPSYSCVNLGPDKLSNLSKVKQLMVISASIYTQVRLDPRGHVPSWISKDSLLNVTETNSIWVKPRRFIIASCDWVDLEPTTALSGSASISSLLHCVHDVLFCKWLPLLGWGQENRGQRWEKMAAESFKLTSFQLGTILSPFILI